MPIPHLPSLTARIGGGAEGGLHFARLVGALLSADYRCYGPSLVLPSDSTGDYRGLDAILRAFNHEIEREELVGFQFKFFPSPLSRHHRASIKDSYISAVSKNSALSKWIAVTPDDLNRHDMEWFEQLPTLVDPSVSLSASTPNQAALPVEHWGHTRLVALLLKYPHIGRQYYPEFASQGDIGALTVDRVRVDTRQSAWSMSTDGAHLVGPHCPEQCIDRAEEFRYSSLPPGRRAAYDAALSLLQGLAPVGRLQQLRPPEFCEALWWRMRSSPGHEPYDTRADDIVAVTKGLEEYWPSQDVLESMACERPERDALLSFHRWFGRSVDPVVELTVTNRTAVVQILYSAGVRVFEYWQELGPSPVAASLVPVLANAVLTIERRGGLQIEELPDPIQIPSQAAVRLKLRLRGFEEAFPSTYTVVAAFVVGASAGMAESGRLCCYFPPPPCDPVPDSAWESLRDDAT